MRCPMPYPCMGSSAKVFRINMSSVPCTTPLSLSLFAATGYFSSRRSRRAYVSPLVCQEVASPSPPPCYTNRFNQKQTMPTREEAWQLLCEYTQSESLRKHMLAVETCVRAYARKNGADEEVWGITALLHDFDYERW